MPENKIKPVTSYFYPLAAVFYDLIILLSLWFGITVICVLIRHGQAISPGTYWYQGVLLTVVTLYYAMSYLRGGQTVGMKAWKIQLVSTNGKLRLTQITARFFFMIPAIFWGMARLTSPRQMLARWTKTRIIRH